MSKKLKKNDARKQSTLRLIGIDDSTDYGIANGFTVRRPAEQYEDHDGERRVPFGG